MTSFSNCMTKSFKSEVEVQGEWSSNALRFATKEEAEAYGSDLLSRWFVPTGHRATETDEPVTHRWTEDGLAAIDAPEGAERMPARRVQL